MRDAQFCTSLGGVPHSMNTLAVTFYPGQSPFLGPSPVPVHDDSDMLWQWSPLLKVFNGMGNRLGQQSCDRIPVG